MTSSSSSASVLQICFISACSNALYQHASHPADINQAIVVATKRSTGRSSSPSSWRHRHHHRRNHSAPASPYRRRRTSFFPRYPDFHQRVSNPFALIRAASPKRREAAARRPAVSTERAIEKHLFLTRSNAIMEEPQPLPGLPSALQSGSEDAKGKYVPQQDESQPRASLDESFETRSARSESSASRNTNRLSLTLPIALPTANPSRPAPASATLSSYPPTPVETPSLMSPVDPDDFITAIAAQERRVLEIREELSRAEMELARLKKQWTSSEGHHRKRAQTRHNEPLRSLGPAPLIDLEERRSVELDRRKALLLGGGGPGTPGAQSQGQQQPGTPQSGRRRVFQGGHARTLSLLSPVKTTGGFAVHEDGSSTTSSNSSSRGSIDLVMSPTRLGGGESDSPYINRYAPITPAQLAKRASWAPRSVHQAAAASGVGVKQIAEDLRQGLWTFMEDLRQATVGDEPITGQGTHMRGPDGSMRDFSGGRAAVAEDRAVSGSGGGGDQDTIRASGAPPRPRAAAAFDETPTPGSKHVDALANEKAAAGNGVQQQHRRTMSKVQADKVKNGKRFSWTPLTIESYDDSEWSSWDSPSGSGAGGARWSGATASGDIVTTIPERAGEGETPLKKKTSSSSASTSTPSKLEELLPPVLNRLTPSNLKRTATNFMKEWEESLSPPQATPTDARSRSPAPGMGKEKGL